MHNYSNIVIFEINFEDSSSSSEFKYFIKDINFLPSNLQNIDLNPDIAKLISKPIPMSITKNWYPRSTPPHLQFEQCVF